MKNVISKSFEIQDYMIEGTVVNGFWMTLGNREQLTTEVIYAPASGKYFEPDAAQKMIINITAKCDKFKSLLPDNVNCEVTFKDFNDLPYTANNNKSNVKVSGVVDEIRVVYRLYVEYYI